MRIIKRAAILSLTLTALIMGAHNVALETKLNEKEAQLDALMDDVEQYERELNEYKLVYDGINVYEDGSWDYREGVDEYWFWNWELAYVNEREPWE